MHFVFRFLHASQAAEILALVCRFFAFVGLNGRLSLADLIGRAFGGEGILGQWQHTSSDYRIIWEGTNLTLLRGKLFVLLQLFPGSVDRFARAGLLA